MPDHDQPEADQPEAPQPEAPQPEAEAPTVPALATSGPGPDPGEAPASADAPNEPTHSKGTGRRVLVLLLVLVVGVGAGFFLGRETADPGPESLADAVSETAEGELPVGEVDLRELLQSIGRERGGALGQILGGSGSSSNGSGPLGGIVDDLLEELEDRIGDRIGGDASGDSSDPGTHVAPVATLGVRVQAAPEGQDGAVVTEVIAGGSAGDAGLRAGDVVTKVGDDSVASPSDLVSAVRSYDPGDQVSVTYTRDGTPATVTVRLGNQASTTTTTRPAADA